MNTYMTEDLPIACDASAMPGRRVPAKLRKPPKDVLKEQFK